MDILNNAGLLHRMDPAISGLFKWHWMPSKKATMTLWKYL
jgi:hypothetical protein